MAMNGGVCVLTADFVLLSFQKFQGLLLADCISNLFDLRWASAKRSLMVKGAFTDDHSDIKIVSGSFTSYG